MGAASPRQASATHPAAANGLGFRRAPQRACPLIQLTLQRTILLPYPGNIFFDLSTPQQRANFVHDREKSAHEMLSMRGSLARQLPRKPKGLDTDFFTRPNQSDNIIAKIFMNRTLVMPKTDDILFGTQSKSRLDAAVSFIRRDWDVEEGIRTFASPNIDFVDAQPIAADVFSALLIFDALPSHALGPVLTRSFREFFLRNHHASGINYFFVDRSLISEDGIAADVDTAAVYLRILLQEGLVTPDLIADALGVIADNTNSNGIVQVFLPPRGNREGRIDPVVCANVLSLLYFAHYNRDMRATEDYLLDTLSSRAFVDGSLQYTYGSTVLYWVTRAVHTFGDEALRKRFLDVITQSAEELWNRDAMGDLDLAMRINVSKYLRLTQPHLRQACEVLASHQSSDGSWRKQSMYRTVRSQLHFGSDSLTTAYAIKALEFA